MPIFSWQDLDYRQPLRGSHPLNQGKVAWWLCLPQQYGNPTLYDLMSRSPATVQNYGSTPAWSSRSYPNGPNSLSFSNAANTYLATNNPLLNITGDITIVCWIRRASNSNTQNRHILGCYNPAGPGPGYALDFAGTTGAGGIAWYDGTSWKNSNATVPLDTWAMVAAVCQGNTVTFYENGVSTKQSITQAARSAYAGPYAIGGRAGGGLGFDGNLSDLAVYNRALSQVELIDLYEQSLQGYPNLLNYGEDIASVMELQQVIPQLPGALSSHWLNLDVTSPLNMSHPLNQNLALRLIALPNNQGGQYWYDLVSGIPYQLSGFISTRGWDRGTSNPNGAGSIRFNNSQANIVQGPVGRSIINGYPNYTWWGWVRLVGNITATDSFIVGERIKTGSGWDSKIEVTNTFQPVSLPTRPYGWVPGGLRFTVNDDAGHLAQPCAPESIQDGFWHFTCVVRQGNTAYLYWSQGATLKSVSSGLGTVTGSTIIAGVNPTVAVGSDPQVTTLGCNGWVNDVGCALYAMTPQQVQTLFLESLNGYPNMMNWWHGVASVLELQQTQPPLNAGTAAPWRDLNLRSPLRQHHPLNQNLALRLIAVPQLMGGTSWYDLVKGTAWQLQNFTPPYGWVSQGNPNAAGSVSFLHSVTPTNHQIVGPSKSLVSGSANYTWWAWIRPVNEDLTVATTQRTIIGERTAGPGVWISKLGLFHRYQPVGGQYVNGGNVGAVTLVIRDDNAAHLSQVIGSDSLADGNWHFVAGVRSGAQAAVYWSIGAQLRSSGYATLTAGTGTTTTTSPGVMVGQDAIDNTATFNGLINDCGLALQALSPQQIQQLFLEGMNGYPNLLNFEQDQSVLEVVEKQPPIYPGSNTPWPDLDLFQPFMADHPLNQKLALRLLALPQLMGSNNWYDLAKGAVYQFQNFTPPYGWSQRGNPGGGGSVRFNNPNNISGPGLSQILGPAKSIVSGSAYYTWWAWINHTNMDIAKLNNQRSIVGERVSPAGNWISKIELPSWTAAASTTNPTGVIPGVISLTIRDDAGHLNTLCGNDGLLDGSWHFVAGVRNGTQLAVYWSMGAQLRTSGYYPVTAGMGSITTSTPQTFVGQDPVAQTSFDGRINDCGCALFAMTPTQIQQLFNESMNGYPNVLNWHWDEAARVIAPTSVKPFPPFIQGRRIEPAYFE